MPSYEAFGVRIDCGFELSELEEAVPSGAPRWRVGAHRAAPPAARMTLIGEDVVYGDVRVRAFATEDGFRLVFDDTGTFDIDPADGDISWFSETAVPDTSVRADLLGRVIAMALHATGQLTLHASAVSVDGRAIAFLGPKHSGKSTLALALVRRGARLITDDTLVIHRIDPAGAWVAPGVQRIRLWEDSARALDARVIAERGVKPTIDSLPPSALERHVLPLDACYVVQGVAAGADVTRRRMAPVDAAIAAVRFAKVGALLGGGEASVVLDRATRLAAVTPFLDATVARDLTRLDSVAGRFVEWLSAVPAGGGGDVA